MLFGKKKESQGLPELPQSTITSPNMLDLRNLHREEINSLPAFPDSPHNKGFSQSAIKEAISPESEDVRFDLPKFKEPDFPRFPEETKPKKIVELEEWQPEEKEQIVMQRPSSLNSSRADLKKDPVYVRLDKFQSAKSSISLVFDKVVEIEKALDEIKELRKKEEEEMLLWEKEIDLIKSRINDISQDLFEKV